MTSWTKNNDHKHSFLWIFSPSKGIIYYIPFGNQAWQNMQIHNIHNFDPLSSRGFSLWKLHLFQPKNHRWHRDHRDHLRQRTVSEHSPSSEEASEAEVHWITGCWKLRKWCNFHLVLMSEMMFCSCFKVFRKKMYPLVNVDQKKLWKDPPYHHV